MMKANIDGRKATAANFAFSGFLFSVFGWALIEAQLLHVAAELKAHLLVAACGLGTSAVALRRCGLWWRSFAALDASINRPASNRYRISDVTSCVALAAAGCVLAFSAKTGSFVLFAICAGAFTWAPWSRFVFCRKHFFTSCSMLSAGAVSILIVTRITVNPGYFLWAWFLWMYALVALFFTITSGPPTTSQPTPIQDAGPRNPKQPADLQLEKA